MVLDVAEESDHKYVLSLRQTSESFEGISVEIISPNNDQRSVILNHGDGQVSTHLDEHESILFSSVPHARYKIITMRDLCGQVRVQTFACSNSENRWLGEGTV